MSHCGPTHSDAAIGTRLETPALNERQRSWLVGSLLFLTLFGTAHAEEVYGSQAWLMRGVCNGQDQVYSWHVEGEPPQKDAFLRPWEADPIKIIGIELTKIQGGPTQFWMAGNNIVGDAMLWLGSNEDHGRHDFPPGATMPMMGKADATDLSYIDLHGACLGGGPVAIYYTVYYLHNVELKWHKS